MTMTRLVLLFGLLFSFASCSHFSKGKGDCCAKKESCCSEKKDCKDGSCKLDKKADHSCCSQNKDCKDGNCKLDKSCCDDKCGNCTGKKGDCGKNCELKMKKA